MSARAPGCPPDEVWAAYPGAVTAGERAELIAHLAACSVCRAAIAELARQGAMPAVAGDDSTVDAPPPPRGAARSAIGARLGRFVVLALLGEGGMGTVVSAYDPTLERKVALKVLRGHDASTPAGHARLLREALALARIAHPHVVPIHEVTEIDGEVVLVMEHVAGRTLAAWVSAERPGWREIVRAYLQAGRGLAAAHAAGLVHRDFKPSNALIGADGRVRVIDFGLVREDGAAAELAPARVEPAGDARLTQTGAVVGTPAYMAPEQFERTDVDARTDVYAFCVSLAEALYGARPTFPRVLPGFEPGEGADPPAAADVPRRTWTVLRRGLAADPALRPASMEALLAELARLVEPARRRWVAAAAAAVAVAGAVLIPRAFDRGAGEPPCSGAAAELVASWTPATADEITAQLGDARGAYGREIAPRVVGLLDEYARAWMLGHRAACLAHRRGEQSAALLDKRMHCLERHRAALASAVALLGRRGGGAGGDPLRVALGLPPVDACASLDALAAGEPPPADPAARARLRELEAALEEAAALERSGDYARAAEVAAGVAQGAPPLSRPRLEAGAHLQVGRARLLGGQAPAAAEPLRAALGHAIAADAPELAAEAIARRIYSDGVTRGLPPAELAERRGLAEDFLRRARDGGFARALLLNNVGVIHRAQGDRAAARAVLREALAARAAVTRVEPELSVVIENLAAVTDEPAVRQALFQRAIAEAEATLGPHHPEALRTRLVHAAGIAGPRERRERLAATCPSWHRFHPQLALDRALCEQALAGAALELGERAAAAAGLEQAAGLFAAAARPLLADATRGHAAALAGRAADARAAFAAARGQLPPTAAGPWERALRAELDAAEAELELAGGRPAAAAPRADAALAALDGLDQSGQLGWQIVAARARVTAAAARLRLGSQAARAEARALLAAATAWYAAAGDGYQDRLRELAALGGRDASPLEDSGAQSNQ